MFNRDLICDQPGEPLAFQPKDSGTETDPWSDAFFTSHQSWQKGYRNKSGNWGVIESDPSRDDEFT